jgi:hypothetical protein
MSRLELEAMIEKTAAQQREDLNWQESIVDLMKLFKLDSSLGARKQLAKELGYTGVLDGSAEMNIWLHRQVMVKLAESGGKVPEHLKAQGRSASNWGGLGNSGGLCPWRSSAPPPRR